MQAQLCCRQLCSVARDGSDSFFHGSGPGGWPARLSMIFLGSLTVDWREKCDGIDVRLVLPLSSRCSPTCPTYRAILGFTPNLLRGFMHSTPELFWDRVATVHGKAEQTVLLDARTETV